MSKVCLGLVGAGMWARSAHLASLAGEEGAEIVAVAARRHESARALAREAEIPKAHEDWRALVADPTVEGVVVATPAPSHHAIASAALSAGKHVLCEAPLACSAEEALELLQLARERSLVHAYVRPRPDLYGGGRVRALLAEGALGTLQSALLVWRNNPWLELDPGVNWRVHKEAGPPVLVGVSLAVLRSLFGPLQDVQASLATHRPGADRAPDAFHAILRTRAGVTLSVDAGGGAPGLDRSGLWITGSSGTLAWEWGLPPRLALARGTDAPEAVPFELQSDLGKAWPYTRAFAAAIRGEAPAQPDFSQGLEELYAVEAALRSAEEGVRAPIAAAPPA